MKYLCPAYMTSHFCCHKWHNKLSSTIGREHKSEHSRSCHAWYESRNSTERAPEHQQMKGMQHACSEQGTILCGQPTSCNRTRSRRSPLRTHAMTRPSSTGRPTPGPQMKDLSTATTPVPAPQTYVPPPPPPLPPISSLTYRVSLFGEQPAVDIRHWCYACWRWPLLTPLTAQRRCHEVQWTRAR